MGPCWGQAGRSARWKKEQKRSRKNRRREAKYLLPCLSVSTEGRRSRTGEGRKRGWRRKMEKRKSERKREREKDKWKIQGKASYCREVLKEQFWVVKWCAEEREVKPVKPVKKKKSHIQKTRILCTDTHKLKKLSFWTLPRCSPFNKPTPVSNTRKNLVAARPQNG